MAPQDQPDEDELAQRRFRVENAAWGAAFGYACGWQDAMLANNHPREMRAEWVAEFADWWAARRLAQYHGGREPILHVHGMAGHFDTWLRAKKREAENTSSTND